MRAAALTAMAAPLAGCDLFDSEPTPKEPDPLTPLINDALDLAARYEATIAGHPDLATRLTPLAAAHRAHAAELARVAGTTVPSAPPTSGSAPASSPPTDEVKAALAALRAAEQQGRKAVVQACLAAPQRRAALLGSIAAARATHLEVLK